MKISKRTFLNNIRYDIVSNGYLSKRLTFANNFQYYNRSDIREYQLKELVKLIEFSYNNNNYYRKIMNNMDLNPKDIVSIEDFEKFPILTKHHIINNSQNLVSKNVNMKYVKKNSTSGSTGMSLHFLTDNNKISFIKRMASNIRMYEWMNLNYYDSNIKIWGASFNNKITFMDAIKRVLKSTILLSGYNLDSKSINNYVTLINKKKPKFVTSYPSIFYTMASQATEKIIHRPKALTIGGEKLYSYQREIIEDFFNAKIFDFYGSRDCLSMACECEKHNGLHLLSDIGYLEVVDENNNVIKEGEGEIVYTSFTNYAMPLIRYKNGDRARISQRYCSCGRTLPLIEEVLGRTFEVIEFPNGNRVGGTFWTLLMKKQKGIEKFEVIQKERDLILINYVPDKDFTPNFLKDIKNEIVAKAGRNIRIEFYRVDEIEVLKNGKLNFVRSELKK